MKRFAALFLALLMVFALFPVSALADDAALEEVSPEGTAPAVEGQQEEREENSADKPVKNSEEKTNDADGEETAEEASGDAPEEPPADAESGADVYGGGSDEAADVNLLGTSADVETELRNAIANGESPYTIQSSLTLSADLTIPADFFVTVDQGTFVVPDGVVLTVENGTLLFTESEVAIRSGGKLVNNGSVHVAYGSSATVEPGGVLENNRVISIYSGGRFFNNGTYTPGEFGHFNLYIKECDLQNGLSGVPLEHITANGTAGSEADIRDILAEASKFGYVDVYLHGPTSIELAADLAIPENAELVVADGAVLTVPEGKKLIGNGSVQVIDGGKLNIKPGAEVVVNNNFVTYGGSASVEGTFTVGANGTACVETGDWSCTGTLDCSAGEFIIMCGAAADELEQALDSGANTVCMMADITIDCSLTVADGVRLEIYPGVKLAVPSQYTLTNRGDIFVYGTLEIKGTYAGNEIYMMGGGTLTPDTLPHRTYGVFAESVTVTGADTVTAGGTADYIAEVLPADTFDLDVKWTITSGRELASISKTGVLTAGNFTGTVTIRATATDGSGIYGEKTVTILAAETPADAEQKLREAIANRESPYSVQSSLTLSADLAIPAYFILFVDQGTFTVPSGVTLTVEDNGVAGFFSEAVIRSGGKLINNGNLTSGSGGSVAVETGGAVENNGFISVLGGGRFLNHGTYTSGKTARFSFDIKDCDLQNGLSGVPHEHITANGTAESEADIRDILTEVSEFGYVDVYLYGPTSIELAADLTIPENAELVVADGAVLTVPAGKKLIVNGSMQVIDGGRLNIKAGAEAVVNNNFVTYGGFASVEGTFTVGANGTACVEAGDWSCTGTLDCSAGEFIMCAADVGELEQAFGSGANVVYVEADITLERSLTVADGVRLAISPGVKLTVPSQYTLTNRGDISVYGALEIEGTYTGNKILVMARGSVTPESIPRRDYGVLAESVTVTGADTVTAGETAEYTAEILPADTFDPDVTWTIVSGAELAGISDNGVLTAGHTSGTVTIRAAAADGSGVYGEKTVTILAGTSRIPGDVDGDGKVTTKDSILIRRYLLGGWDVALDTDTADVDKDGKITAKDSILIRRYLLGGWNVELK